MPSSGRPFITNKVPFEQPVLDLHANRFTRPWHDYFLGLSQSAADVVIFQRDSELIGPQIGADSTGDVANYFIMNGTNQNDDNTSGGFVPVLIPLGETFTVPVNFQALFAMTIDVQGSLVVDGYLVQVN